jgi:acyl dehydratase
VFIGDTIRVKVQISQLKDHKKPGFGLVSELLEVTNQHQELVMICEHILLVQKKQIANG